MALAGRRPSVIVYFIYGFQFLNAQDPSRPRLTVSPEVIRETESVRLSCETPPSPSVSQCNFRFNRGKDILQPCDQSFTGTQILSWVDLNPPVKVLLQCNYKVEGHKSPFISETTAVRITEQPILTVSPAVIRERDSVQLSCEPPPSLSVSQCYFYIGGGPDLQHSSCQLTLTGTDLLVSARQSSPAAVQVKCYYYVAESSPSPHSVPVSVTVRGVTVSSTSVPGVTESPAAASQTSLAVVCVAVFVVGLVLGGLIAVCIRWRTKIHLLYIYFSGETHSTSRTESRGDQDNVVSTGPVNSKRQEDAGNSGSYSLITCVAPSPAPSGFAGPYRMVSDNDDSDTYHVYCSIADTPPAVTAATDQTGLTYSLLQPH